MANTYVDLIDLVLADYNSIWTNLKAKPGLIKAFKDDNSISESTLIRTNQYGNLIERLVFVDGANSLNIHDAPLFNATTASDTAIALGSTSVTKKTDTVYDVATTIASQGLYTAGTKLSSTIDVTNVVLNETAPSGFTLDGTTYKAGSANGLIGSATVAKGSAVVTTGIKNGDAANANLLTNTVTLNVETAGENTTTNVKTVASTGAKYMIKVNAAGSTTGKITASAGVNLTEGYIKKGEIVAPKDSVLEFKPDSQVGAKAEGSAETVIYVKAGELSLTNKQGEGSKLATATITPSSTGVIENLSTPPTSGYYSLTSAIEGLAESLDINLEEGYLTADDVKNVSLSGLKTGTGVVYLKQGKVNAQEIAISDDQYSGTTPKAIQVGTGTDFFSETANDNVVTINVDTTSSPVEHDVDYGFIKDADSRGSITVKGSKNLYLKDATVNAKLQISDYNYTGYLSAYESTSTNTADYKELTITPTASVVTTGFKPGWINNATSITTDPTNSHAPAATFKLKTSKVENDTDVFNTEFFEVEGDGSSGATKGEDDKLNIGDLFLSTEAAAVAKGLDYFKIQAGFTHKVTPGWTDGGSHEHIVTRYMPKATFAWIDLADGEEALQVKTGGYIPSGVITEISKIDNLTDYSAVVEATLSTKTTNIIASSKAANTEYYEVEIAKGAIDAGYISTKNGTLSTKAFIKKGAGSVAATAELKDATVLINKKTGDDTKYTLTGTLNVKSNLDFTSGYIGEDEFSDTTATETQSISYDIAKAGFTVKKHTTTLNTTAPTTIKARTTQDKGTLYEITPSVTNCSASYTVTPGYIAEDITVNCSATDAHDVTATAFSIHPGAGITGNSTLSEAAGEDAITFTNDFDTLGVDNYTITMSGKVSVESTLDEGYYGSAEKVVNTGLVALPAGKTTTVARGHVQAIAGGSVEIETETGNESVSFRRFTTENPKDTTKSWVSLKTKGTHTVTINDANITEGYVKKGNADVTTTSSAVAVDTIHIERYTGTVRTKGEDLTDISSFNVASTIGQPSDFELTATNAAVAPSLRLATDEKYVKGDTVVTLSADAMGTNVMSKLLALQERMLGAE